MISKEEREKDRAIYEAAREVGQRLQTQNNRATDAPIFIVEEQRRRYGMDPDYADDHEIVWLDTENDHEEADAEERAHLNALHDSGEDIPGRWTRTSYVDEWHFVTACFTEAGCEEYIRRNGHNHRGKLRIYAAGSYRNEEFRAVRSFLMTLPAYIAAAEEMERRIERIERAMKAQESGERAGGDRGRASDGLREALKILRGEP